MIQSSMNFLTCVFAMDETLAPYNNLEEKQQWMERRHSISPRPQKFNVQKSAEKIFAFICWDCQEPRSNND